MTEAAYRYAVYFAPRVDSDEWQAGSRWLGRCASRNAPMAQPAVPGVAADELQRLTQAPRRYGWHATLKAPFVPASGVDEEALRQALRRLAGLHAAFDMPRLKLAQLDDFLALVPDGDSRDIDAVAAACLTELHALAAPLSPAELARRRAAGLTPQEDALLLRWGYPFVLEGFRFHMSLTGSLRGVAEATVQALKDEATRRFGSLPQRRFDTLSLFAEPLPGADFVLVDQMPLRP